MPKLKFENVKISLGISIVGKKETNSKNITHKFYNL